MRKIATAFLGSLFLLPSFAGIEFELSNGRARAVVSSVGGRVVSFRDCESGLDCVVAPGRELSPAGSGAFCDLIKLRRGSTGREPEGFEYQVVSTNATEAVLLLKTAQLHLRKRIALSGKTLTASYELTNPARRPFTGVFRSCSLLKAGADGTGRLLVPKGTPAGDLTDGMMADGLPFDPAQPKVRNLFVGSPANGRLGWETDRASVVLEAPFPVLDKLYVFMPDRSVQQSPQPTFEWYSDEFELKPYADMASYAERHPECVRPEDLFVYRFSVSIEMSSPEVARNRVLHGTDSRPKDRRFSPALPVAPVFREWETEAAPVLAGRQRRLKVLSVNTMDMSNEMLEFARRFDCDLRIVEVSNPHVMVNDGIFDWYSWRVPDPARAFARALEERYDVIFMAGVLESALPDGVAAKIVARVREGTGFVYASHRRDFPSLLGDGPKVTPTRIPYELLPCELDGAVETRCGRGTVVWIRNRMDACGRHWTRGSALMPVVTRQSQVGDAFRDIVFAYAAKLFLHAAGEPFDQPLGDALAAAIERSRPAAGISTELHCRGAGEPVGGSVAAARGDRAVVSLVDGCGRVLARKPLPLRAGEKTDFSLRPERPLMQDYACCRAEVFADGRKVGCAERPVVLEGPRPGRLNFVVWGNRSNPYLERPEVLRRIGFDAVSMDLNPGIGYWPDDATVEDRLRAGLRVIPIGMHQVKCWKIESRVRKPCLRDPRYAETVRADVARVVDRFGRFRPFMWLSGDENSVGFYDSPHDMCIADPCLAGFRKRMQAKFGTVDALNAVWGTEYRSFADIVPVTLAEAAAGKATPSWYEHRLYMMEALPDTMSEMGRSLARTVPDARLGFSGQLMTGINNCFNWKGVLESVGGAVAYIRHTDILPDMIRCWSKAPNPSFGGWIGYGAETNCVRWQMVDQIANGLFSPAYWWSPQLIRRGDGRETADGLAVADTIRTVRESACEEMVAACAPVPARVAIVHSLPSFVASAVVPGDGWLTPTAWTESLRSWAGVIRDVGYGQPDVIDASDLGQVDLSRYEAVVLPLAIVMSDRESTVLGEYVGRGGKVLYDVFCARSDDRLVARREKPAFLSDRRSAALVPHRLQAYGAYRTELKKGGFWRNMVGAAFASVGLKPGYAAHPGFNCRETRDGASRYFLITQGKIDEPGRSVIPLGRPLHLYDAFRHRSLGVRDRIEVELPSYGSALLAALPEAVASATVECVRTDGRIDCRIRTDSDQPRFFRVKLFVGGVERREYARTVRVVRHGGTVLDLGLDGDADNAAVEVLDVLTGEVLN